MGSLLLERYDEDRLAAGERRPVADEREPRTAIMQQLIPKKPPRIEGSQEIVQHAGNLMSVPDPSPPLLPIGSVPTLSVPLTLPPVADARGSAKAPGEGACTDASRRRRG